MADPVVLKIAGVDMPNPAKGGFTVEIMDIDSHGTTRNANGDTIRYRIATKRKLICRWPACDNTEMSTILKAVKNEFFSVEYPDPMEGKRLTKTFYVGDRQSPAYSFVDGVIKWEGLGMNFVER